MAGRCARFKFSREISPKKACQSLAKRVQDFPTWAEVAQLVEQGTENPRVGSSILSLGTIYFKGLGISRTPFSAPNCTKPGMRAAARYRCKGASHESHTPVRATMIDLSSSRIRIPGGLWLYLLDTYYFKSLIFARLEPDARQSMTLHKETDQSFAAQICAEALVRGRKGKLAWVRKKSEQPLSGLYRHGQRLRGRGLVAQFSDDRGTRAFGRSPGLSGSARRGGSPGRRPADLHDRPAAFARSCAARQGSAPTQPSRLPAWPGRVLGDRHGPERQSSP